MSDLIERQAAIDGILHLMPPNPNLDDGSAEQLNFSAWKCALTCAEASIKMMPSAQPYTDAEIQKMQDLEQAQFDKMYQLGYEEGKQAAQAQGMKSRWFNGRCLRCGEHAPFHPMASAYYESNFCPSCGAWMLEEPYKGGQG